MNNRASLNHIFRTVWNKALGAMVAVAEIATSAAGSSSGARMRGKAALGRARADGFAQRPASCGPGPLQALSVLLALAFTPALQNAQAQTLPQGAVAVHGSVTTNYSQPNKLVVTTTNGAGTQHSATNWNSFSISAGATTQINQPSAASLSVNRVVTNTPSQLFGTLQSNGKVVLVNQSGIAVGAGALVDTAGFTASAVGMTTADAIAGRLRFAGGDFNTNAGALSVAGNIVSRGGDVVLIAPTIDLAKTAVVEAQNGSVSLAAGQSVEITGRGLEGITLQVQAPADQALNLGQLKGDAVGIFAGTLKHSGLINAVLADGSGGKVVLRAKGNADVEGNAQILARGDAAGAKGGSVDVLGNVVWVGDNSVIDVSGQAGGGQVRVGGDYQGKNAEVPNAQVTWFGPQAQIRADALDSGNGGRVIVWADDTTRAHGSISAKGGAHGGDGGFVETSGHKTLQTTAKVDTSSASGMTGTWLLDPNTVRIVHSTSATDVSIQNGFSGIGDTRSPSQSDASESILTDFNINNALASNSVWIFTAGSGNGTGVGDIIFDASTNPVVVNNSSSAARNLTLTADGTVRFINGFTTFQSPNPASSLNVKLNGNFGADTAAGAVVHLNGGSGFGHVTATVDTTRTWVNNGMLSINGNASVQLNQNLGASTFFNTGSGVVNVGSTSGWAFTSNSGSQDGIITNNGTFNVTAGTAFEALYDQGLSGTLNVKDTFLNLQNAGNIQGTVDLLPSSLGASTAATLNVNENHGNIAAFTNTVFPSNGSVFVDGGAHATFSGVFAPLTAMHVGTGSSALADILTGSTVFSSLTVGALGSIGQMVNANLGINGNDLVVPAVGSFSGNNGFYATGNITLPLLTDITLPGDLTLMAGWDGASGLGVGALLGPSVRNIGLFSNVSLFPNSLNLYAKGNISQGSGFLNVANLTASTGGNITLAQNNFVSGDVNLTSSAGSINFNGTAGSFNIGGANALGNITITSAGSITSDGSIGGANVSIVATGSFNTIDQISATGNLTIDTSGTGGHPMSGSGFNDLHVGGVTVLNAGAGNIQFDAPSNTFGGTVTVTGHTVALKSATPVSLGNVNATNFDLRTSNGAISQQAGTSIIVASSTTLQAGTADITLFNASNDFGSISLTGGHLSVVDASDLSVTFLSNGADKNVYIQAAGQLNLPGQAIDAGAGQLSLLSQGGSLMTAGGLTGSTVLLNALTDIQLNANVTGTWVIVQAGGQITHGGGSIDTSAVNGPITLSGASIGAKGNEVAVKPGSGAVQLTAATGGIYVRQAAGNTNLLNYTVSSAGVGQDIWLLGSTDTGNTVNVRFDNFNANTDDDKIAVIAQGVNGNLLLDGPGKNAQQFVLGAIGPGGQATVTSNNAFLFAPDGTDVFSLTSNVNIVGVLANFMGDIRVTAGGGVTGSGDVTTSGGNVAVTANSSLPGAYGSFVPTGAGGIDLGVISTRGSNGSNGGSALAATGANAGNVTLVVEDAVIGSNIALLDIKVNAVNAQGALGGTDAIGAGQAGGNGGIVSLTSAFLGGFNWTIDSSGGKGGNASAAGQPGGAGGDAGNIAVQTTQNFLNFHGAVYAKGGIGGDAVLGASSAAGGAPGLAGTIGIIGMAGLGFNGLTILNNEAGFPGTDNTGAGGFSSAGQLIHLTALNNDITQLAGSAVNAAGMIVRVSAQTGVILADPGNQFGEMDGSTSSGNINIVGLYGIGDNGMSATSGNLSLTGLAAQPLYIQGPLSAGTVSLTGDSIQILDTIAAQNLNLTSTSSGGISQSVGGIEVPGTTTITGFAGSTVNISQSGNNFGRVDANLSSGNLLVNSDNGLALGNITTGNLTVFTGNSAVTQAAGTAVNVTNAVAFNTGAGNINVTNPGNTIAYLGITSAGMVDIAVAGDIGLNDINAQGFNLTSTGNIFSFSHIVVGTGGISMISTNGGINLNWDGPALLDSDGPILLKSFASLEITGVQLNSWNGGDITLASSGILFASGAVPSFETGGRWLTYLTNPSALHQFGLFDPIANANFRQVGATIATPLPAGSSGNGSIWIDSGTLSSTLLGNITKTYDGTTALPGFAAALGNTAFVSAPAYLFGEASADLSTATAVLASPNAGGGIGVTMAPLNLDNKVFALNGTPTYGYTLSASGNIGTVTPVGVTVASLNGTRDYDGTNIVNANIFNIQGLIGTQTLSLSGFGTMADKNVGVNKLVNIGLPGLGGLALGNGSNGGLASNYTLTGGTHQATITPKDEVSWVGGSTGLWTNPSNWAGFATPDGLNNVVTVSIPAGVQVTFNGATGTTRVQNINSLGGINLINGHLQVGDTLKTQYFDQSSGLLNGAGKLVVTGGFTKTGGVIDMGGPVDINQTSGNLVVGGIAGGNILLTALNGGITQTGPIATSGVLAAHSAQAMVLNAANNNLDSVVLLADSGNVELTNVGAIKLVDVGASNGNIKVNNTGGVVTKGKILAPNGNILIVANSPLTVLADSLVAAGGNVDLIATNQTSSGNMLINGQVISGGNINLGAASNFTQNGQLAATGGINAIAGGTMNFGPLAISSGSPVNYRANGASVTPPPGSLGELLARSNGTGSFINTFLNKFEEELESQQVAKNDTPGKKRKDDITVEGESCRP